MGLHSINFVQNLGVTDYLQHCKQLVELESSKPLSLEVFADDELSMIKRAEILSDLGKNVFVKVPITLQMASSQQKYQNLANKNII